MFNILGKRYLFFLVSAIIIIPGLIILAIYGLNFSIDFTGGSLLELKFDSGVLPPVSDVTTLFQDELDVTGVQVQTSADDVLIIRTPEISEETRAQVIDTMQKQFGSNITMLRFESVGGVVSQEVASRAALAVAIAALGVILYITFAFRGIEHSFRYGLCAIAAMLHDILVMISVTAIAGKYLGWQFDTLFLTAFLTVIGFSVQDKIVVFDRIRENSGIYRKLEFEKLANHSIVQTLQRSINTQLMTSEFLLLALALLGGVTLREFSIILLIGLFMGTYSSIFIAAPILVIWENKEWRNWFGQKKTTTA